MTPDELKDAIARKNLLVAQLEGPERMARKIEAAEKIADALSMDSFAEIKIELREKNPVTGRTWQLHEIAPDLFNDGIKTRLNSGSLSAAIRAYAAALQKELEKL